MSQIGRCSNPECGKEFKYYPSQRKGTYCSYECQGAVLEGTTRSEEECQAISEGQKGQSFSEEHKKALSESNKETWQKEGRSPQGPQRIEVEETGHVVDSSWEVKVDKLLHEWDVDYELDPPFELEDMTYHPDFQIGDIVVEVKGRLWDRCEERAEGFMNQYPQYTYIVVGNDSLPHDVHIPEDKAEKLRGIIDD